MGTKQDSTILEEAATPKASTIQWCHTGHVTIRQSIIRRLHHNRLGLLRHSCSPTFLISDYGAWIWRLRFPEHGDAAFTHLNPNEHDWVEMVHI